MDIHVTNRCTHACLGCYTKPLQERSPRDFPEDRFATLLDEAMELGVRGVALVGAGEPLCHPRAASLLGMIRAGGLTPCLLTNGALLDEQTAGLLVREPGIVRVGLDAATQGTYRDVHRSDDFDRVIEGVRAAVRTRDRGVVGLKYTVCSLNLDDIGPTAELATALGVNYIQFKALRQAPQTINADQERQAVRAIDAIREKYPGLPVVGSVRKSHLVGLCRVSPLHVFIDTDGAVYLCTYFEGREDTHAIGNVFERPLTEIWGGARHLKAAAHIHPALCQQFDCRFHRYNARIDDQRLMTELTFI